LKIPLKITWIIQQCIPSSSHGWKLGGYTCVCKRKYFLSTNPNQNFNDVRAGGERSNVLGRRFVGNNVVNFISYLLFLNHCFIFMSKSSFPVSKYCRINDELNMVDHRKWTYSVHKKGISYKIVLVLNIFELLRLF
jgi:hypothetical protein